MLDASQLTITVGDWSRKYLSKVLFPLIPADLLSKNTIYAKIGGEIDLYVSTGTIPESGVSVQQIKWAGQWANWAGPLNAPNTFDMTIRIDRDWMSYNFFYDWKNLCGSDSYGQSLHKVRYVGQMVIMDIDVDKITPTKSFKLHNVFVAKVGAVDKDKAAEELQTCTITMAYDRKEELVPSPPQPPNPLTALA